MPKEEVVKVEATYYFKVHPTTYASKLVRVTCPLFNIDGRPPKEVREKRRKRSRSESVDEVEPEGRRRRHGGREKKKKRVSSRSSSRTPEVCKQHRTKVVHPQVGEQLRDRVQPQEEGTNSRLRAGGVCAGEGRERGGENPRAGTSDREYRREVPQSETRRERDSPRGQCNPGDAGAGPVRPSATRSPARRMIPKVGAGWMYELRRGLILLLAWMGTPTPRSSKQCVIILCGRESEDWGAPIYGPATPCVMFLAMDP